MPRRLTGPGRGLKLPRMLTLSWVLFFSLSIYTWLWLRLGQPDDDDGDG